MSKNDKDESNYLTLGITFGTSLGIIFGMLVFDNLTIGLAIGLSLGVAYGSYMDSQKNKSDEQG